MNNSNDIASFIARKLAALNHEHRGIPNIAANEEAAICRVKTSMEKYNAYVSSDIGFEGVELSPEELAQMRIAIPSAFKDKPVVYEATANYFWGNGALAKQVAFAIEVNL